MREYPSILGYADAHRYLHIPAHTITHRNLQLRLNTRPLKQWPIPNIPFHSPRINKLHAQLLHLLNTQEPHTSLRLRLKNCLHVSNRMSNFCEELDLLSSTLPTPSLPPAPSPNNAARPTPTPRAPRHNALTTSVPRLIPPSTQTSTRSKTSGQYLRISSSVWTAGGAVSRALPP